MPNQTTPAFTLWRFCPRVAAYALAAGFLWQFTMRANGDLTIWIVKFLHALTLHSAPYMLCDHSRFFWHATMFPPVVALTLASYWLPWPDRILRTLAGYLAHCAVTAVAITINESPYLQSTEMLQPFTSTLVNANYLVIGVAIWVLAAGPWHVTPVPTNDTVLRRCWQLVRHGWLTRVLLLVLAFASIVPAFALFGSPEGRRTRADVAQAVRAIPFFPRPSGASSTVDRQTQNDRDQLTATALRAIQAAIANDESEDRESGPLWYLAGRLFDSLRHEDELMAAQHKGSALQALRMAQDARGR